MASNPQNFDDQDVGQASRQAKTKFAAGAVNIARHRFASPPLTRRKIKMGSKLRDEQLTALQEESVLQSALLELKARLARHQEFGADIFGEPVWDMMLDLFVSEKLGRSTRTSKLAVGADVPLATSIRYLELMEDRGVVERFSDPNDLRLTLVKLTEAGTKCVERYFSSRQPVFVC